MILIDTNSLLVLLIGIIDKNQINSHKRTSIYDIGDFENLIKIIGDYKRLVVLPNIWTEVDNLLNGFSGDNKKKYIDTIKLLIQNSTEQYLKSKIAVNSPTFWSLGLTDTLILELGKGCEFGITTDSKLADFAVANNIIVYDMVKERNKKFI